MPLPILGGVVAVRALPWKLIGICGLGMAMVLMFAALRIEQARNVKLRAQVEKCAEDRKADQTAYRTAQKQAAEQNKAQVQRIVTEQEKRSAKNRSDYARDLAKLRGMRKKPSADKGAASGPKASPDGQAPGGADGDGVPLPPGEYLSAQEIELRLMHLQNWVRDQLAIPR